MPDSGRKTVFVAWHETLMLSVFTHRDLDLTAMVSRHSDGEYLVRVASGMGFGSARGSTTRGGITAMRGMLDSARAGHGLAVTPDGPKGPRRVVQQGVVQLAGALDWPIVPVSYAVRGARRLQSWDRFCVPRPFTRVAWRHGAPVRCPADPDEATVKALCGEVTASLDAAEAEAHAALGMTNSKGE